MRDTQNEIKQNIQGTNSDGKEIRSQVNDLKQEEEINIQPELNEARIQIPGGLGTSRTSLNVPTSES